MRNSSAHYSDSGERGAALAVALVVLGLMSFLAVHLLVISRQSLTTAEIRRDRTRMEHAADAAAALTEELLRRDDDAVDHLGEAWNAITPQVRSNLEISVRVVDENSKYNLRGAFLYNGQENERRIKQLTRLCTATGCPTSSLSGMLDWMDSDEQPRMHGAESGFYRSRSPAYNCKNRLLDHLGELQLIPGGADLYTHAGDYLTVFSDDLINVNTASAVVLSALTPTMNPMLIRELIELRAREPLRGIADLYRLSGMTDELRTELAPSISFRSHYFSARITVSNNGRKLQTEVIWVRKLDLLRILAWSQWYES